MRDVRETLVKARHRLRVTPAEYRRGYRMRGRKWMLKVLYPELMQNEMHWMGVRALKNPLDAWVYQEILYEVKPTAVVELPSTSHTTSSAPTTHGSPRSLGTPATLRSSNGSGACVATVVCLSSTPPTTPPPWCSKTCATTGLSSRRAAT